MAFLKSKPDKPIYKQLLAFSGWIGVNSIVSSISGRLDIAMLASLAGASATGLYSIPARLASFIVLLSGSFSAVLAPRLAGFLDKNKEKAYIIKSTYALIPVAAGIIIWIIFAKPFSSMSSTTPSSTAIKDLPFGGRHSKISSILGKP